MSIRLGRNYILSFVVVVGLLLAGLGTGNGGRPSLAQNELPAELPGSLSPDLGQPVPAPTGLPAHDPVTVVLAAQPDANLDKLARQMQDPASPLYRHFLTDDQYRRQVAPDPAKLDALKKYFAGQGLQVVYTAPDNAALTLTGSSDAFDRAFGTHSELRQSKQGVAGLVNTQPLKLPATLAGLVAGVAGMDGLHPAQASIVPPRSRNSITPSAVVTNTPASLRQAYNLDATGQTGAGSRVGILLWQPPDQNTLANWQSYYGHNLNLNVIGNQTVITNTLVGLEANMDVEMVHLAAYDAQINFYSAYSAGYGDLTRSLSQAVNDDLTALSGSFTSCERDLPQTVINSYHSLFQSATVRGTALFFSSGDNGIFECAVPGQTDTAGYSAYPAGDDLVTSVGGTSLSRDTSSGVWLGETGWSCPTDSLNDQACYQQNGGSSEGGKTVQIPRPAYQSGITPPDEPRFTNNAANTRLQPDLSTNADPASGILVFYQGAGVSNDYYSAGTSASTPLLAGVIALATQEAGGKLGGLNPFIYSSYNGAAWYSDVISGYNGTTAKPGWDYMTGLGSVKDFNALIEAFEAAAARPYLHFDNLQVSDAGTGNRNGLLEPGENGTLQFSLKNVGSAQASPVIATLSLLQSNPNFMISTSSVNYGAIGVGATVAGQPFGIQVSRNAGCNEVVKLRLAVSYGAYSYTYDFSLSLGSSSVGSQTNYGYTGGSRPIPDATSDTQPGVLTTTLNISTVSRVNEVRVHLDISHTYVSDLGLTLISPSGTSVRLATSRGGAGQNYTGTVFDDNALYFIGDAVHAVPPFTGTFQPEGSLSSLANEPAGGTWQLVVTDSATGDSGTLLGWSLDLTPLTAACAPVPYPTPAMTGLTPATVQTGTLPFTLGLSGTNFSPASTVLFNGQPRSFTYVSDQQLLITVSSSDVSSSNVIPLKVSNPTAGGGGGTTAVLNLNVTSACPSLTVTLTSGVGCGTLPTALSSAGPNDRIGFALPLDPANRPTILLSGPISLPTGASLTAPCTTGGPAIIIQASSGLTLRLGQNFNTSLGGLWFKSVAGGQSLVATGGGTRLSCVKISK